MLVGAVCEVASLVVVMGLVGVWHGDVWCAVGVVGFVVAMCVIGGGGGGGVDKLLFHSTLRVHLLFDLVA